MRILGNICNRQPVIRAHVCIDNQRALLLGNGWAGMTGDTLFRCGQGRSFCEFVEIRDDCFDINIAHIL